MVQRHRLRSSGKPCGRGGSETCTTSHADGSDLYSSGSSCGRGSSAKGRSWWEAGRRTKKQNSFDDFAACADYLVDSGITSPDSLAIMARAPPWRPVPCHAADSPREDDLGR